MTGGIIPWGLTETTPPTKEPAGAVVQLGLHVAPLTTGVGVGWGGRGCLTLLPASGSPSPSWDALSGLCGRGCT